jgi:uncharacterized membrane protein YfcA
MHLLGIIEIGIAVGLMIGMTGIGSGTLLTPLLILWGGMTPATAVGTSLVFSFASKLFGTCSFYRRGLVQMEIVRDLSLGGLPGALAGAFIIRYLGVRRPDIMNTFLMHTIGCVLIIVSILMVLRMLPLSFWQFAKWPSLAFPSGAPRLFIVLVGFGVGTSVTLTSIGSGAALIPLMVLIYRMDSGTMVGTNLFMGTILAAVAALPHIGLGNVDSSAVGGLLLGAIPALWIAGQLHGRILRQIPEGIIATALMAMGVRFFFR